MNRRAFALLFLFFTAIVGVSPAHAWDRGHAERFATFPTGTSHPEGLAVDANGNFYAADLAIGGTSSGVGQVVVFDRDGRVRRVLDIAGSTTMLLGLDFHPLTHALLVIDFGGGKVFSVDPQSGASTVFATVSGPSGLNGLTFDAAGNVYLSDSFQGIIWKTGAHGGAATPWVTSPLLTTSGVPPFGANGLGFNRARNALFVANTGNDTVVRIPVSSAGVAGTPAVFVNSINGPDGLLVDGDDNLWVVANQADEIVVVDPTGRVIAKLGDFDGIALDGGPRGLLFPASLVRFGDSIYVTNLALDLRALGIPEAVDSQWAADTRRYTISRLPARIPPIDGGRDH
jgi:sugar lactone lactonase YvrE